MKVAIFGCRDGKYLYEQIQTAAAGKYTVVYFCDNSPEWQNRVIDGIPVIGSDSLANEYFAQKLDGIIIAVRKGYSRYCIIKQLQALGIFNILLLRPSVLTFHIPIVFDEESPLYKLQWLNLSKVNKPIIHHLEVHAADGCNLKCRGCLHFANLYNNDEFPDLDRQLDDIAVIAHNCEVFQFRVLGGEPLLNPRLSDFLAKIRKLLSYSDVAVISNGILIPRMDEKLFQVMRENHIGFNLTLYPPTLKMRGEIYETLEKQHIPFGSHESRTDKFEKFLVLDKPRIESKAFTSCVSRGVLLLKEGKLYKCPLEAYIGKYLNLYGYDILPPNGVDIRAGGLDWNVLCNKLTEDRGDFCQYCSEKSETFDWGNGKPVYTDWLVTDK